MKIVEMLVIDDHQLVLDGLKHLLAEHYDLNHIEFATSADLVKQFTKFELLITDLYLPAFSGFDLLESLNEQRIVIPTIVLSSSEDAGDIKRAIDLGVSGFIPKSTNSNQILTAIETVLAGGMSLSASALELLNVSNAEVEDDYAQGDNEALSKRQLDSLKLIEQGFTNRQIASILKLSESTVKSHIKGLFRRLDVTTRTGCVRAARDGGYL